MVYVNGILSLCLTGIRPVIGWHYLCLWLWQYIVLTTAIILEGFYSYMKWFCRMPTFRLFFVWTAFVLLFKPCFSVLYLIRTKGGLWGECANDASTAAFDDGILQSGMSLLTRCNNTHRVYNVMLWEHCLWIAYFLCVMGSRKSEKSVIALRHVTLFPPKPSSSVFISAVFSRPTSVLAGKRQ